MGQFMQKWIGMINTGFGRCRDCLKAWFYTWWPGQGDHFPLVCIYCGKKEVLRIEESELSPDDKIIIYNEIIRRENA
jgi:hypothetical protein